MEDAAPPPHPKDQADKGGAPPPAPAPDPAPAAVDEEGGLTLLAQVEQVSGAALARALPSALFKQWLMFKKATSAALCHVEGFGV